MQLTGVERAAVLFLGLPADKTSKIVEMLGEDEIRLISRTMSRLGKVDPAVVETVLEEFAKNISSSSTIVGSQETTEKLLRTALTGRDDLVDSIMQDLRGPSTGNTWDKIATVDAGIVAAYLANEHPQVVAVVLSQLFEEYVAQVLALLPPDLSANALARLLELKPIDRQVLDDVERAIRNDLGLDQPQQQKKESHGYIADLIGRVSNDLEAQLLGSLEVLSPEHAAKVRKYMFSFADLIKISKSSIQALLQDCDRSRLAVALSHADDSARQVFLENMSERQAKMFRDELETLGNLKKAEVEAAQKEIVLLAKALAAAGQISLQPDDIDGLPAN